MAYFLEDDEKSKDLAGSFKTAGGASGAIAGGDGGGAAVASPGRKPSGGFVNLEKYMQANQGAGDRMAGAIGKSWGSEYGQDVDQLTGQTTDQIGGMSLGRSAGSGYFSDPSKVNQSDFDSMYNQAQNVGSFQGMNINDKWADKAGLADTQSGRETLLGDEYQRNNYGAGMKGLDALFMGTSEADLKGQAEGMGQQFSNLLGTEGDRFGAAQDRANQSVDTAQRSFRGAFDTARGQSDVDSLGLFNTASGHGKDYIQRGQAADAKSAALNQLVGEGSQSRDWAGVSKTREDKIASDAQDVKDAETARVAAVKAEEQRKYKAQQNTAKQDARPLDRVEAWADKMETGIKNPIKATAGNVKAARETIDTGVSKLKSGFKNIGKSPFF